MKNCNYLFPYNNASRFPCKNCKERKPACHDSCKKYKEAKNRRDKIKEVSKVSEVDKYLFIAAEERRLAKLKKRKKELFV